MKKKVVLSTGLSYLKEIREAVNILTKNKQEYFGNFEGVRRTKTKVATLW